jgi:DNA repair exonuclease SbcCD nuclease subunit
MAVKFLHTADWQIGKPFARFPEEAAVPLREQRIETVKKIAALAVQHSVDAVLVAGDVFEFETVAERTLHKTIHAMSGFSGPWLMLPGNHDPAIDDGVWCQLKALDPPSNIVILDKAQTFPLENKAAVVLSAPLMRRHEPADVTEWFDSASSPPGCIRIGLAHGSVDNRLPERGDAPNTISDARAQRARLDYLALGDWHGTLQIAERTWYAGTHETDRFRANDSGNVLLVTIDSAGKPPLVQTIPVGHYRWRQLSVDVGGTGGVEQLGRALEQLPPPLETIVLQLSLRGSATLETRTVIDRLIARYAALLRYLDYRDEQLVTSAADSDLEELCTSGVLAETVRQLQQICQNAEQPEREQAQLALQILYAEHKQLAGKRS